MAKRTTRTASVAQAPSVTRPSNRTASEAEERVPMVHENPPQPAEDNGDAEGQLSVPAMLSKLTQHFRNLRRFQVAYADLVKQHQSIGVAEDLRVPPLMPKWKSADDNDEMLEVGVDFAWIPDEYLEPMLQTMINACGSQFQESISEIHKLSGDVKQCLQQMNPES